MRELRNVIRRACLLSEVPLIGVGALNLPQVEPAGEAEGGSLDRLGLEKTLERNGGNVSRAARELGLSRQALYRRMEKLGLKANDGR